MKIMRKTINALWLLTALIISGQVRAQVPDTVIFSELRESIELFGGEIVLGQKTHYLSFSGDSIGELELRAFGQDKQPVHVDWEDDTRRYLVDRNLRPVIDMTFRGATYRLNTELIRADNPGGGEINWKMVPRLTFIRLH
jgi:hypothetical protein